MQRKAEWLGMCLLAALLMAGCQSSAGEAAAGESPEPAAARGTESKTDSTAAAAKRAEPDPVELPEGTEVPVRITSALSTRTHKAGESFDAVLAEDVSAGERVIARRGANARGVIVESDPGGRVKGRALLAVRLTELETADGDRIEIHTNTVSRTARPSKKKDAAKVGIGTGIGAAIGAIAGGGKGAAIGAAAGGGAGAGAVLATRGEPAEWTSETLLRFTLRTPAPVS